MKETLRQSMTWLHTWSSLIVIWLLFAVFVTGTLSFFRTEITHWMQPEGHGASQPQQAATTAIQRLQQLAPDASRWDIQLPGERSRLTGLSWSNPGEVMERRRGPMLSIDPATGETLDLRETAGGNFLYRFHFELYGIPRELGRILVGIASMLMLVALVSGVIMHRKIFTDFFSFRPGKKTASWIDAHVIGGVLALPFHLMITFSGLILLASTLLFWNGGDQRNGPPPAGPQTASHGPNTTPERPSSRGEPRDEQVERGARPQWNNERPDHEGARSEHPHPLREKNPSARHTHITPTGDQPAVDINAMIRQAQTLWDAPVNAITVEQPNQTDARWQLSTGSREGLTSGRNGRQLIFDNQGQLLENRAEPEATGALAATYSVLRVLHEARFADTTVRWLLFVSGILGSLMVATGAILWVVKRSRQQLGQLGYELVSTLNLAAIAGLLIAIAGYFWANRLLPAVLENRESWEIRVFFGIWLLSLLHALFQHQRQGWVLQLSVGAALFGLIPLLDPLTSRTGLWFALQQGDWIRLLFDLVCLLMALVLLVAVVYLRKVSAPRRPTPEPANVRARPIQEVKPQEITP
ncbi:PepSY-associated TM helix domain-containing protein [Parathalassolituus penaei]|uniref:PepSY-associated TM helix domain-containing protein n=1 Tax=Parathalassolituus penaei TaxID=2997323 RepID=A0A9X3EAA4_9GAMM|nr:PepSY-associated TM helix domain-containing protein [Parathalassolituus penaei]MCY0963837.1 PepSY-associated TM helix domain-containing protein [Parathalassolituus penaei]